MSGYIDRWQDHHAGASTYTLTINGATAGNLIVAAMIIRANGTYTNPSQAGWGNPVQEHSSTLFGVVTYTKIATGVTATDSITFTCSASGALVMFAEEHSTDGGPETLTASAVDYNASGEPIGDGVGAVGGNNNWLSLSILAWRDTSDWASDWDGASITAPSGYSNVDYYGSGSGASTAPSIAFASKYLTSTSTEQPQWSSSKTPADDAIAIHLVFDFLAPAAGTVAFPSGHTLHPKTKVKVDLGTEVDTVDDGRPNVRVIRQGKRIEASCVYRHLTLADKDEIVDFIETNREAKNVAMFIDGTEYVGWFSGSVVENMDADRSFYNLKFTFKGE